MRPHVSAFQLAAARLCWPLQHVATLSLHGRAGFWGEMLAMFGAFKPAAGLHRGAYLTFTAIAAASAVEWAGYVDSWKGG